MTPDSTSLYTTQDGTHTLYSANYGVTYHSRYGAITESNHVFIEAGLRYKAVLGRDISILEAGFGTGLNALLTYLEAEKRGLNVRYTALEKYPITSELVHSLNYPSLLGTDDLSSIFLSMHTEGWEEEQVVSPSFRIRKLQTGIEAFREEQQFDLIYFDAFAPQAQPELWQSSVFSNLFDSLRPEGVLVTYCAQGEFKRTLKHVGFKVERLKGPPGKREMTRAWK
jgi:tRNA U34 5-methylaminomethyl-2-thiouridine-forming methyltransferase MnmC